MAKKNISKQKKMDTRVNFTPMVDMMMLLITFFMLCTTLKKPQTMEISMPSNDKNITEEDQTKVAASRAITILLGGQDKVYYYSGQPDYTDYNTLSETTFNADGLRAVLQDRNREIVTQLEDLKKEKLETGMEDEEFNKKASEIKNVKTAPVVMIKGSDASSYKNLIDALDDFDKDKKKNNFNVFVNANKEINSKAELIEKNKEQLIFAFGFNGRCAELLRCSGKMKKDVRRCLIKLKHLVS